MGDRIATFCGQVYNPMKAYHLASDCTECVDEGKEIRYRAPVQPSRRYMTRENGTHINEMNKLCPSDKNVIYWDVDEFYEVSNETHNSKANSDCPTDLNKLFLRWLRATCKELVAVANELLRNINELLQFFRHGKIGRAHV